MRFIVLLFTLLVAVSGVHAKTPDQLRKEFIDEMTIESRAGFALGLELTVKAHLDGRRIEEVPATWHDRSAGESRFRTFAWMPHYLKWYFRAFLPRKRRHS